ncbi:hypothetical protein KSP40_PGU014197 [Platanthera guangdongensis]|uniref:KIB1-4 beta-propeller domain-containing protein n=1 Tax=Platanthera guangdongensis TaxID=2320717 RepID=A0ABR2LLN1_9ASPA
MILLKITYKNLSAMACSTSMADWRNLLPEIVLSMAQQLVVADIIRLRSVCVNWARALGRSSGMRPLSAPPRAGNLSFFQPSPWLLLPNSVAHASSDDCAFFSIIEDRLYKISSLPQLTGRNLLGTSQHGWLVTIDNLRLTPRFFNPLTKEEIPLPSLITIPRLFVPQYSPKDGTLLGLWYNTNNFYFPRERFFALVKLCLKKIILTSSPMQGSIAVVLCITDNPKNCLSFARVGGASWSPYLKLPGNFDFFEDVVFNEENNKLYALTNLGAVFILECRNNSIEVLSMVSMRIRETPSALTKTYMFFSSGELMQVTWNLHLVCCDVHAGSLTEGYMDTAVFKIFRFDPDCYNRHDPQITDVQIIKTNPNICPYASCWVPVNDLGGQSLFIGSDNCFTIDCGDEQKRNKVFFLYNVSWLEHISQAYCVYDLKSNEIEHLNSPYDLPPAKYLPIWFLPALTV